jgi:hypothetical protein
MASGTPQERFQAIQAQIASSTQPEHTRVIAPSKATLDISRQHHKTIGPLTHANQAARLLKKQNGPA